MQWTVRSSYIKTVHSALSVCHYIITLSLSYVVQKLRLHDSATAASRSLQYKTRNVLTTNCRTTYLQWLILVGRLLITKSLEHSFHL